MTTIQKVKEFWNTRPCNIKHSPLPIGSLGYFNKVAKRRYFVEPHIRKFAQFDAGQWWDEEILEIGCGIGTDLIEFAKERAKVTGVDISKRSIAICKQRFEVYGLEAHLYVGDAEHLTQFLPRKKYRLIYSFGAIHHTPRPYKVLCEIRQYCNGDTQIRIMLYSKVSWKVFWIIMKYGKGAFWRTKELVRKYSEAQEGCPVTYCYTFREIRELMNNYGFEIIEMRKAHIFPYKIDKYKGYEYEKEWYFRIMPRFLFRWLERSLGWHTLIVAKLKGG
jgi:SAM-dependent methyltransferase